MKYRLIFMLIMSLQAIQPEELQSFTTPQQYSLYGMITTGLRLIHRAYVYLRTSNPLNVIFLLLLTIIGIKILYDFIVGSLRSLFGLERSFTIDLSLTSQLKDINEQIKMVQKQIRDVQKNLRAQKIQEEKMKRTERTEKKDEEPELEAEKEQEVDNSATYRAMQQEIEKNSSVYRQIEQQIKECCVQVLDILRKFKKN